MACMQKQGDVPPERGEQDDPRDDIGLSQGVDLHSVEDFDA